jgi:hypothetical protein
MQLASVQIDLARTNARLIRELQYTVSKKEDITDTDRLNWLYKERGYSREDIDKMIISKRKLGI